MENHFLCLEQFIFYTLTFIYFTKSRHVATLSFMPVSNYQATDSKKNKFTLVIVLESADPYLLDRVEFKHTSLLNLRQDMLFI